MAGSIVKPAVAISVVIFVVGLLQVQADVQETCMQQSFLQLGAKLGPPETHTHTQTNQHVKAPLRLGDEPVARDQDMTIKIQAVTPLYYFHVPKTGGTPFSKALLLMPGVCSEENLEIIKSAVMPHEVPGVLERQCAIADMTDLGFQFSDHSGVGSYHIYDPWVKGHAFTMMRQPEQRIMSGYLHQQHSWPFDWEPANALQYAHAVAGCSVKMLTRDGVSGWANNVTICGDPTPVTSDEIDLAVKRLNTGFVFVGILEEWDLSICLLHAKFGGPCTSYEMAEGHTTSGNSTSLYNTSELGGWTDLADGRMYDEANRMFEQDLQKYGVSMVSCSACFAEAR